MKYLVLAYYDVKAFEALTPAQLDALVAECRPHDERLKKTGRLDTVAALSMPKDWKTIRAGAGKAGASTVTDGPYAETKEQVGSFFILEAKDMDEAVATARLHPGAHIGHILGGALEVRACDYYEHNTL